MSKENAVLDQVLKKYDDNSMLKMDGFDDCVVGVVLRFGQEPILCYSSQRVIKKLVSKGMTEEEAEEHWEFNQLGAWVGERTPCFLDDLT
jgi:hypothetical protein